MNDKETEKYVFKFECAESWENLTETENKNIRHCQRCDKNVHLVQNSKDFAANAEKGNCVFSLPMRTAGMPMRRRKFLQKRKTIKNVGKCLMNNI